MISILGLLFFFVMVGIILMIVESKFWDDRGMSRPGSNDRE
jgi:hypothetical protein